ncbi:4'-phosphopantetheinyl transferase family protein [Brotaphodocola sp.]|uniref:4'-phosphopantetheinyl transferase family protein n=1 Tax=Brotaphodocola sp. TaxID=3073577 RepID=UPI003D7D606E
MSTYVDLMRLDFPEGEQEKTEMLSEMKGRLSKQRIEKADRFRRPEDEERCLAAGILLDHALMRFGRREKTEKMGISEHGKPMLLSCPELFFNLSHSGDFVMSVISDRPCGCDVEEVRQAAAGVSRRFFCEEECREIFSCPEGKERDRMFTCFWTMKESYVKMTGTGLTIPLDSFRILLPQKMGMHRKYIAEKVPDIKNIQTEKMRTENGKYSGDAVGRVIRDGQSTDCALYDFSECMKEKREKISGGEACASLCLSSEDRDVFFSFQKLSDVI